MEIAELYTPLSQALAELERRQGDLELKAKVDEYFKDYPSLPELAQGPRAVVARAIFTPMLEFLYFMDMQKHLPLKPILYEFTKDKFVGLNAVKAGLGNMTFYTQDSQGNKTITSTEAVVDFATNEGKSMREIKTIKGEPLIEFHHRLLHGYFENFDLEIAHFSDWFKNSYSFNEQLPYQRYLGLFLHQGILFENFTSQKNESSFTRTKVIPAFADLVERFGIKPLIVPINPRDTDDQPFWCYYPDKVRTLI